MAAVDQHRHQRLAGDRVNRRAVGVVDHDRLDRDALVGKRERDPLDVGGERSAVELQHGPEPKRTSDRAPSRSVPLTRTSA
jgi:hypothetical protein